jgi:hypothetical protein
MMGEKPGDKPLPSQNGQQPGGKGDGKHAGGGGKK